jgi:hypothetical protein
VGAVAVLILNDHVLKGAGVVPEVVTGKLSDVAGLFFFPILLVCVAERLMGPRLRVEALSCAATAAVFTILKTCPDASSWATRVWGEVVCDPSDLLALPSVAVAYACMMHERGRGDVLVASRHDARARATWERLALVIAAMASVATSRPPRPFTAWTVTGENVHHAGCAALEVWVSKSGKEGVGVSLASQSDPGCAVRVERATLVVGGRRYASEASGLEVARGGTVYLPFLFDNESLWNEGERAGNLELDLVAGGERVHLVFPMKHEWDDANRHDTPSPPSPPPRRAPYPLVPVAPDAGMPVEVTL